MDARQTDASGADLLVPTSPKRLVSLVPSVTETLFALGLGPRVVGVTDWCLHPATELEGLPRVGGTKNPDLGSLEALAPDLVLANLEENREIDVRRLRERGLRVWVDFPCTVAEVLSQTRWLAMLGAPETAARSLLATLEEAVREAARRRSDPVRCFLAVWKDPWMTISSATYAHDLLAQMGFVNVFADAAERYPRVDLEQIAARDPEIVLLPDEPYAFDEDDARLLRRALTSTTAGRRGAIHAVDGTLAFWHGPRTARALRESLVSGRP